MGEAKRKAELDAERKWATPDDISDALWQPVELPVLGKWVRVRVLGTADMQQLAYLPDLADFSKMAAKFHLKQHDEADDGTPDDDLDIGRFAAENTRYQAWVVHASVPARADVGEHKRCQDCRLEHPEALWTPIQTQRLDQQDLAAVCAVALSAHVVDRMRPFSTEKTPDDTHAPADSGG